MMRKWADLKARTKGSLGWLALLFFLEIALFIPLAFEGIAKLRFGSKSALFGQDPDSAQVAYSHLSMSTCAETGPAQKSSNLASKASFAIPSVDYFTQ